jgi:hypothetical protein
VCWQCHTQHTSNPPSAASPRPASDAALRVGALAQQQLRCTPWSVPSAVQGCLWCRQQRSAFGLVVCSMLLQIAIELHARAPGYKRTAALPQVSRVTMLAHNIACWVCYTGPACLWDAWAQPSWNFSSPGLVAATYW